MQGRLLASDRFDGSEQEYKNDKAERTTVHVCNNDRRNGTEVSTNSRCECREGCSLRTDLMAASKSTKTIKRRERLFMCVTMIAGTVLKCQRTRGVNAGKVARFGQI